MGNIALNGPPRNSIEAAIRQEIERQMSALRGPGPEWVPAESLGYRDRRQVRRDAEKHGVRYAALGHRTFIHAATFNALLEAGSIRVPSVSLEPENDEAEIAARFGMTVGGAK